MSKCDSDSMTDLDSADKCKVFSSMVDKVRDMKRRLKDDEFSSSDEIPLSDLICSCSTKELTTEMQSAQNESENEDFMIDDDDSDGGYNFQHTCLQKKSEKKNIPKCTSFQENVKRKLTKRPHKIQAKITKDVRYQVNDEDV